MRRDGFWEAIVTGEWNAWPIAVHEAAELHAFMEIGVNPFDHLQFGRNLETAHFRAVLTELRFLCEWARSLGMEASELAIEAENPMRKPMRSHAGLLQRLQTDTGQPYPAQAELDSAALLLDTPAGAKAMRARLLMTLPADGLPEGTEPPVAPALIVEDGAVGLFSTDWERILDVKTLEDVTEETIRRALNLPRDSTVFIYLTPAQDVPNANLFSEAAFRWRRLWWKDTLVRLIHEGILPGTPLLKAS
jgi:hypothetical protein